MGKNENALTRWSNATIGVRTKVYKVMPRLTDGFYYALGMHIPYGSTLSIGSSSAYLFRVVVGDCWFFVSPIYTLSLHSFGDS